MAVIVRSKQGRVALVTGAAQGLGRAFAMRLAAEGASVVAVDRADAPDLSEELEQAGASDVCVLNVDISEEEQVEEMAATVLDRFDRCDLLINNAGILKHASLANTSLPDWRRILAVNIDGTFLVCRALVPAMAKHGYGRVVNLASDMLASTSTGFYAYFASKGAVVGFTRALANEFGEAGVTANCLVPGLTRTPRTEAEAEAAGKPIFDFIAATQVIKRHSVPDDLVGAMSFLTSDDAAFMTGTTLIVNGGAIKTI